MINPTLEQRLRSAEYTLLRYQLRLMDDVCLPPFALLRLRREFTQLLKSGLLAAAQRDTFFRILHPPLPVDPLLRRRFQQPAPAFTIIASQFESMHLMAGAHVALEVCFFGQGLQQVKDFSSLLQRLGDIGLFAHSGRFGLDAIEDACSSSPGTPLWIKGPFDLTPQIRDLSCLLSAACPSTVRLDFESPARLMTKNRPLFKPDFAEIFPFLLRRVTALCAAWAHVEEVFDVDLLLERASQVTVVENRLSWRDWRPLSLNEEVGGLVGSLTLTGAELYDLWPLLKIGELFGIGKGAAYGAGRYQLSV